MKESRLPSSNQAVPTPQEDGTDEVERETLSFHEAAALSKARALEKRKQKTPSAHARAVLPESASRSNPHELTRPGTHNIYAWLPTREGS
jgi:hypothetical protein